MIRESQVCSVHASGACQADESRVSVIRNPLALPGRKEEEENVSCHLFFLIEV